MPTVRDAFLVLLGKCDGARTKDHVGFNGRDASFAHSLGEWSGKWTRKQERAAHKMLRTYKGQLSDLGFDYDELEFDNEMIETKIWMGSSKYGPKVLVQFEYDIKLVNKIKKMSWEQTHRRWNPDISAWELDANSHVVASLEELGFALPPEVLEACQVAQAAVVEEPEDVTIVLGASTSVVRGILPKGVLGALSDKLGFYPHNYERTYAYQQGDWDGMIRLFKKWDKTFPTGLLALVRGVFEQHDIAYQIEDRRDEKDSTEMKWFGWDLRPYQRKALDKALTHVNGVIMMPTGSGKTLLALKLIQEMGRSAVVLVHRKELLYQWQKCFYEYLHVEPGLVGDGQYREGQFTIAMLQTLRTKSLKNEYDIMIADEVHHIPAETFQKSAEMIGSKYRYGLSATPRREDNRDMMIWAQTGLIVANITVADLVEDGFLAKPKFVKLKYDGIPSGRKYQDEYRELIQMPPRNDAIVDFVTQKHNEGYKIYVDVKRIKHGRDIRDMLIEQGIKAVFISGRSKTSTRQEVLASFEKDGFVLVSTLIKEGVDLPAMNMIVLAGGGKSGTMVIQTIGRALRPKPEVNEALVVDLKDGGYYTRKHFNQRQDTMRSYYGDLYDPMEVEG